jgi:hypothetical protein
MKEKEANPLRSPRLCGEKVLSVSGAEKNNYCG